MAKKKFLTLVDVMPANYVRRTNDTAKQRYVNQEGKRKVAHTLRARCEQAWNSLEKMRLNGERTMNYTFADDQWGDIIETNEGPMTEREYIQRMGNVPLTDNMMISIFSSITGIYDKQAAEPVAYARDNENTTLSDMMTATMQSNWQNNDVPRTLSIAWRTFLNTGVAMVRSTYDQQPDGVPDVDTRFVNPFKAFWEAGTDPNLKDLTLIGVLCDEPREMLYQKFARPEYGLTVEDINEIFHIHSIEGNNSDYIDYFGDSASNSSDYYNEKNEVSNLSFSSSNTPHCYRVIEAWSLESKSRWQCWDPIATSQEKAYFKIENDLTEIAAIDATNAMRIAQAKEAGVQDLSTVPLIVKEPIEDTYWRYTFMASDGTVLCEGETPYDHKSHPFTLLLFPMVNGKIYPYMSFPIDQQRNINRLNIMNDLAIKSATKGLTIYPEDIIPDDMTPEEFNDQLTSYRGVVRYKLNNRNVNARPDILTSNPANLGIPEMIQMKINLMQQTANVSGALQGKTPTAGTAASRYAMEAENSTTSLFSLINDFSYFMEHIALKNCELIKQYYEDNRLIFGLNSGQNLMKYDRWGARDVKFKLSIRESAATAAHQQRITDTLNLLLERQAIDILQYLDNSPEPFAKQMADQIRSAQQAGNLATANLRVPDANQQEVAKAQQMMGFPQSNQPQAA